MIQIIRRIHKKRRDNPYLYLFVLTVAALLLLGLTGCACRDYGVCPKVFPNSNQF
jgi:hypothetical protein